MTFEPYEYHESPDQEFLNGVRTKIALLEFEAAEKEKVMAAKRNLRRSRIKFYGLMSILTLPFLLLYPLLPRDSGTLLIWGGVLLSAGAIYENSMEIRSDYSADHDYRFS